ncbi:MULTISPECIES: TetR/AcrR family transcriptional regulator [Kocuria]|uniref:TetR/AcrR family transcriptional regulator n=1 Tax=Kocuria TaxID=57493 RepID=UPI00101B76F8|nr:TetR/AcrR family transcriptional regulator [Kocuria carniphila]
MKSRQDWLEAGLDILGGQGLPGLRIEALCSAVGATRGSFYHHFVDMPGYRVALLEEFELRWTSRLIDHAESIASQGPASQLQVLSDDVVDSLSPREAIIERNVRAWATQDADAATIWARIDARRLAYLTDLLRGLGYDQTESERGARHLALLVIGANLMSPPSSPSELREVFQPLIENLLAGASQ